MNNMVTEITEITIVMMLFSQRDKITIARNFHQIITPEILDFSGRQDSWLTLCSETWLENKATRLFLRSDLQQSELV